MVYLTVHNRRYVLQQFASLPSGVKSRGSVNALSAKKLYYLFLGRGERCLVCVGALLP